MINRRDLLQIAAAAGATGLTARPAESCEGERTGIRIVDTNVSLFPWPFRRLPLDRTATLVKKLRSLGIVEAWTGSFEGILHRDVAAVNQRLAAECRPWPELIPVGSVNLELPDWKEDLRRCIEQYDMPGVRLHPNYHGYALNDGRFVRLLEVAAAAGRFVQIAAALEDTRTQHPLLHVADVDLAPLPDIMKRWAGSRLQILNWRPSAPMLEKLAQTRGVYFDTARVDGTDGIPRLVQRVPEGRVLFGTHAPLLIPEAALIRVHESGRLTEQALRSVLAENAQRLTENAGA